VGFSSSRLPVSSGVFRCVLVCFGVFLASLWCSWALWPRCSGVSMSVTSSIRYSYFLGLVNPRWIPVSRGFPATSGVDLETQYNVQKPHPNFRSLSFGLDRQRSSSSRLLGRSFVRSALGPCSFSSLGVAFSAGKALCSQSSSCLAWHLRCRLPHAHRGIVACRLPHPRRGISVDIFLMPGVASPLSSSSRPGWHRRLSSSSCLGWHLR